MSSKSIAHPSPFASDLAYLQEELNWIEARSRRLMLVHKVEAFEGRKEEEDSDYYEDEPIDELQEKIQIDFEREQGMRQQIDARLAMHFEAGQPLALDRLCQLYDLDDFERTVLLLAVSPCFSRTFDSMLGKLEKTDYYSHDLNVEVVFNFCRLSFIERIEHRSYFSPTSSLLANDLISISMDRRYSSPRDLLNATIQITHRTFSYILGDESLDDAFIEFSSVEEPKVSLEQVVLEPDSKRRILSVVEQHGRYLSCRKEWGFDEVIRYGRGILMLFHGVPGTGKTMMAHAIAKHMNKRILNVDIPTFLQHHDTERFLPGLFREARLQNAILFFDECEALFGSRSYGNMAMTVLLTELERFEGVAILATNLPEVLDPALDRRILVKVRFPEPDRESRLAIWKKHIPDKAPLADDVDLGELADRFEMTGGYIKNAVLMAVAAAVHDGKEPPEINMEHFLLAGEEQIKTTTENDTEVFLPQARLQHLKLPEEVMEQVKALLAAYRHRRIAYERWKVGRHLIFGKGLCALFEGPRGAGKTLCAEAITYELNRPIHIGLGATLVHAEHGHTERSLEHLFASAARLNAVLLIEDLDHLFLPFLTEREAIRVEMIARTLCHLLERQSGLVLMTSHRPEYIPEPVFDALHTRLHFPLPSEQERAGIWKQMLPASVPIEADLAIEKIAASHELNGRDIRKAAMKAALSSAATQEPLSQAMLEALLQRSES